MTQTHPSDEIVLVLEPPEAEALARTIERAIRTRPGPRSSTQEQMLGLAQYLRDRLAISRPSAAVGEVRGKRSA